MSKVIHHLHDFLKTNPLKNFRVELTDNNAVRFSYFYKIKFDIDNIEHLLETATKIETFLTNANELELTNTQNILLRQSLWVNAIVTYGRLFTDKSKDAAEVKHVRLHEENCYKNCSKELKNMHTKIMNTRHKYVAHGVENEEEFIVPYMFITKIKLDGNVEGKIGVNSVNPIRYSKEDLNNFIELLSVLKDFVSKKLVEFTDILFEAYKDITAQQWFDLALKNDSLKF